MLAIDGFFHGLVSATVDIADMMSDVRSPPDAASVRFFSVRVNVRQHEFTCLDMFFRCDVAVVLPWWDVFLIHPPDLHWTCYFTISYVRPAKYIRIRCRRSLREKYKIKGYLWRIHTNSLMRDHHLQPKAISSKRINAEIVEDDKKFRWISVIHERWVARCQGHNESGLRRSAGAMCETIVLHDWYDRL